MLLAVEGLTVKYGMSVALRGVSISVPAGAVVGILGANGAGKTTLLRAIHGRVPSVEGKVLFNGDEITRESTAGRVLRGVAMCPENRRLFPNMSIEDNLILGGSPLPRREMRTELTATYGRVPWIGRRHKELAGRLSGGEQQMVAIARSLMARPRLLMLDEPSSGLSPVAIADVQETLAALPESGTTVLLVEQNVKMVSALCSTAWVLARGEIQAHGPTSELMRDVALADAYLGGGAVQPAAAAVRLDADGSDDVARTEK